jgi:hypothetical protein
MFTLQVGVISTIPHVCTCLFILFAQLHLVNWSRMKLSQRLLAGGESYPPSDGGRAGVSPSELPPMEVEQAVDYSAAGAFHVIGDEVSSNGEPDREISPPRRAVVTDEDDEESDCSEDDEEEEEEEEEEEVCVACNSVDFACDGCDCCWCGGSGDYTTGCSCGEDE